MDIPVVGASFADGAALAQRRFDRAGQRRSARKPAAGQRDRRATGHQRRQRRDGGRAPGLCPGRAGHQRQRQRVVRADRVAEQLGKLKPENTLRFAWWGAEESGLIGSTAYVNGLSQAERDRIALYLNFDMIGSPNYIQMVYDSDESGFEAPVPVPPGSIPIEDLFESFYTLSNEPYDDADSAVAATTRPSSSTGFRPAASSPGPRCPRPQRRQAIWGGTTGAQYDPCYHLACDTFANFSLHALDINSDAVAFAVLTYAYSTESVNGVPGKKVPGNFTIPAPAGPEGTVGSGGGADHERSETS